MRIVRVLKVLVDSLAIRSKCFTSFGWILAVYFLLYRKEIDMHIVGYIAIGCLAMLLALGLWNDLRKK